MAREEIATRRVGGPLVALAALLLLAVGVVLLLLRHWNLPAGGHPPEAAGLAAVPGARLQAAPQQDLARYRAEARQTLEAGGWQDRAAGRVRLPIADAMALVARGQGVRGRGQP